MEDVRIFDKPNYGIQRKTPGYINPNEVKKIIV